MLSSVKGLDSDRWNHRVEPLRQPISDKVDFRKQPNVRSRDFWLADLGAQPVALSNRIKTFGWLWAEYIATIDMRVVYGIIVKLHSTFLMFDLQ